MVKCPAAKLHWRLISMKISCSEISIKYSIQLLTSLTLSDMENTHILLFLLSESEKTQESIFAKYV